MGDRQRVVRSAKYELPIYNLTNKVKYMIGSIHLKALTSCILPEHQKNRLIGMYWYVLFMQCLSCFKYKSLRGAISW